MDQSILGIILVLIGLFPILAVMFGWKFFLENWRAKALRDIIGETSMKRFYILFGGICILVGLLIIFRA